MLTSLRERAVESVLKIVIGIIALAGSISGCNSPDAGITSRDQGARAFSAVAQDCAEACKDPAGYDVCVYCIKVKIGSETRHIAGFAEPQVVKAASFLVSEGIAEVEGCLKVTRWSFDDRGRAENFASFCNCKTLNAISSMAAPAQAEVTRESMEKGSEDDLEKVLPGATKLLKSSQPR